jgi:hypothetical protein
MSVFGCVNDNSCLVSFHLETLNLFFLNKASRRLKLDLQLKLIEHAFVEIFRFVVYALDAFGTKAECRF